jgi:methionyl-tRNA synthetase
LRGLGPVLSGAIQNYNTAMNTLALDRGCAEAFRLIDATNEFIASSEPWSLAKRGEEDALDGVLWSAAEAVRIAAVLLSPVIPSSAGEILQRVGAPVWRPAELRWDNDLTIRAGEERTLQRKDALWPRLEIPDETISLTSKESSVTDQLKPESAAPPAAAPAPAPSAAPPAPAPSASPAGAAPATDTRISIDEFMKIDLRVAKVLSAERVANSRKLMKMQIDVGSEQRTIVAGIAEAYEAEALVGRHVAIVANLKPAKLMGIESNGMVLAASPDGGQPVLVAFDAAPAPGTRVR